MSRALLFGKMPAHGDFVARGVDPARREAWDRWLAESLARAKETLGPAFEERYDSAPAWRFAMPEGVEEGGGWLAGAIAPSMDSVGRRFPLLVACATGDEARAPAMAAACEDAIYQAFGRGLDADQLHAGLIGLAEGDVAPPLPGWWTLGNEAFGGAALGGERPEGLMSAMLGAAGGTA